MLTSKVGVGMAPIAGVLVALNESMVVTLKAGELLAPDADWLIAPKGVEEPNMLLPILDVIIKLCF